MTLPFIAGRGELFCGRCAPHSPREMSRRWAGEGGGGSGSSLGISLSRTTPPTPHPRKQSPAPASLRQDIESDRDGLWAAVVFAGYCLSYHTRPSGLTQLPFSLHQCLATLLSTRLSLSLVCCKSCCISKLYLCSLAFKGLWDLRLFL